MRKGTMTATLPAELRPCRQSLKFTLGEIDLFWFRFAALEQAGMGFGADGAAPLHTDLLLRHPDADAVVVRDLPVQGPVKRLRAGRQIRYAPVVYQRYYVEVRGTFADYLKSLSHGTRKTMLRHVRRFQEASGGEIAWREFSRPDEAGEFYELATAISRTTYQHRLNAGLPVSDSFRRELQEMAAQDELRGYVMFLQGAPVAFALCRGGDDLLGYQTGYDPRFRDSSPGTILHYLIFQRLFAEGRFARYDFGESEQPYKVSLANASVRCARVYYFRRTFRNLAAVTAHLLCNGLSTVAGRLLEALKVKQQIRKWIRSHGTND